MSASFTLKWNGLIINPHNNQLPVSLTAYILKHFTNIAEVRVGVTFSPEFFRPFSRCF